MYVYMYECMHASMFVCVHASYMYVCLFVGMYAGKHPYIFMYIGKDA